MDELKHAIADALLKAWMNATDEQKLAALAVLRGESTVPASAGPFPAVLSPKQAARLTNLTTRSLRTYAHNGLIQRVYFGGLKRSCGYSAESVKKFIEDAVARGAVAAKEAADAVADATHRRSTP